MARGRGRNRNTNAGYAEVEMEQFDDEGREEEEEEDVPTIEVTAVAVAEPEFALADDSTVTCCFQWIRFHWNWKRFLLLACVVYALGFGSGVVFTEKNLNFFSANNSEGKLQDADNDDNMFHQWKQTTTNTHSPAATTTTVHPNNEGQLVPMAGSAFQDKICKNVTYRLEKPLSQLLQDGGPIILWAHNYAVGNAPAPAPVGPFDDPAQKHPNIAHVVLHIVEEEESNSNDNNHNKKEGSSWMPSLLQHHHHQESSHDNVDVSSIVLVLSSYSMTTWNIEIPKHTSSWHLSKIIATGYERPQINIIDPPPTAVVEQELIYAGGTQQLIPGWRSHWPPAPGTTGVDLRSYKNAVENHVVGGRVYQYDYCYHGGELLYHFKLH